MAKKNGPSAPAASWTDAPASLETAGATPSFIRPNMLDASRDRFADTSREDNPSTRVTAAQASQTMDFRSQSRGEEDGCPIEVPDPFGFGTVTLRRSPDPWGSNRPVGGVPDPNAGRPRP